MKIKMTSLYAVKAAYVLSLPGQIHVMEYDIIEIFPRKLASGQTIETVEHIWPVCQWSCHYQLC